MAKQKEWNIIQSLKVSDVFHTKCLIFYQNPSSIPEKKMRESVPRQVEKKSRVSRKRKGPGVLEEEIGVWNSQGGGKDKHFFFYIP